MTTIASVSPDAVNVDELMTLETHVPGGTITDGRKVRCMEIMGELEAQARGAYTGSMGYSNRNGSMDFNILIRTMTVDTKTINLHTDTSIVYDPIPDKELDEARAKARGLLLAIDGALE